MSVVVVTGATGLVGSRLVPALAHAHEVHALSRSLGENVPGVRRHLETFSASWSPRTLPSKADAVIHLAQSDSHAEATGAATMFDVNVISAARLLEWAAKAGVKRFVLASSGGVYGRGSRAFTEQDPVRLEAASHYLRTRAAAEILAGGWRESFQVIVLRFFFVYGSGQKPSFLVPRLVDSVRSGRAIDLQGEDGIRINPVHVDDAAKAVERALGLEKSDTLNVGGPEVLTMRALGNAIGAALGKQASFHVDAKTQAQDLVGDIERMSAELAAPVIRFADGIRSLT